MRATLRHFAVLAALAAHLPACSTVAGPAAQPLAPRPMAEAAEATTHPIAPPASLQQLPSANAAEPVVKQQGVWSYEAKSLAAAQGCKTDTAAWLIGEPHNGTSRYYVDCGNGRAVVVACDSIACTLEPF